MLKRLRAFGPGLMVTAAFIGPGTVTTASNAGATYGFALLWAVLFSIFATMVLQEMASRLGLVTGMGLGTVLRHVARQPQFRVFVIALVLSAIFIGNSMYQGGNLGGAAAGLTAITNVSENTWMLAIAAAALVLLALDRIRMLEVVLIGLVGLMSITFLATALLVQPSLSEMAASLFPPAAPSGSLLTIIALIGTTVVPYNLFLHASTVCEKRTIDTPLAESLTQSRIDTFASISVGGLITIAILTTSAAAFFQSGVVIQSAGDMSTQLRPLLGDGADVLFPIGLFAAGLTSSITAPLAAGFATLEILGWNRRRQRMRFLMVCAIVVLAGVVINLFFPDNKLPLIVFAQAANGLLLPVIAVFLLVAVNRQDVMGKYKNGLWSNVFGISVLAIATGLGVYHIWSATMRAMGG